MILAFSKLSCAIKFPFTTLCSPRWDIYECLLFTSSQFVGWTLYSATGARFSRAKVPCDCDCFLLFLLHGVPNSCSENDCLRMSVLSTTEENWRSMSSSCVADAPRGRFCSFPWFWHSASVVVSSLQFLLFLFKYRVNNSKIIIKPTMVDTPAITSTIGGESAMEKM